jgi:hypothetical protein
MLGPVLLGHLYAVGDVLLKGRVHDKLLGDRMPSELPDELVLPLDLVVVAWRRLEVVVVLPQLVVVVLDAVRDARRGAGCHGGSGWGALAGLGGLETDVGRKEGAGKGAGESLSDGLGNGDGCSEGLSMHGGLGAGVQGSGVVGKATWSRRCQQRPAEGKGRKERGCDVLYYSPTNTSLRHHDEFRTCVSGG